MLGRFAEARRWWEEGTEACRELGERVLAAAGTMMLAQAKLIAGEPKAAERVARQGVAELEEIGEHSFLSTVAFYLAEALLAQGKLEEAEEATELSERNTATDDVQSMAGWRATQAKILALRGETQRAEVMAREAVTIIEETDYLDSQAEALLALATVLRLAGKPREAIAALEEAERKWQAKGHVVGAAHARSELDLRLAESRGDRYSIGTFGRSRQRFALPPPGRTRPRADGRSGSRRRPACRSGRARRG